ncbi:MAG: 50S ribosomal protein L11 [Patescibacteria group bacterium]
MAKKLITQIKLQIKAGQANPAPPIGPALGQHGVNIMDFCNQFNNQTKDKGDLIFPVVIDVFEDRSFSFIIKTPPTAVLIKMALNIPKGSSQSLKEKVGKLTKVQIEDIAKTKLPDLNTNNIEAAKKIIIGTAKNMGVEVSEN